MKDKTQLVELTQSQIYTLYETVVNNIEDLSFVNFKGIKVGPKSGKYQYKWDELHILKDFLNDLIDWDAPCKNTEDMCEAI